MKIVEVIKEKQKNLHKSRMPVIAFLGDSVTQGCFDLYVKDGVLKTYTEAEKGYPEKVKVIFRMLYPEVPITVINAGISGDSAKGGLDRLDRDVLNYNPDIVVVCFGLNDAGRAEEGLDAYINSLKSIFAQTKNSGAEVIFMTPNLRTTKLQERRFEEIFNKTAEDVAQNENEGWLVKYLESAREICMEEKVPVCDCNRIWKTFKDNDVNINNLLSNKINHPTEEMHWIFAYELVKLMFK